MPFLDTRGNSVRLALGMSVNVTGEQRENVHMSRSLGGASVDSIHALPDRWRRLLLRRRLLFYGCDQNSRG